MNTPPIFLHPHEQAALGLTAPLTAEVLADAVAELTTMINECREEQAADLVDAEHTGERPDLWDYNLFMDVGGVEKLRDMLTSLATQLAERDAELARVTAERDSALAFEMLHISELEKLHPRIAALTEALNNIRELNMTGEDENGHKWAHSDLIEQEIVFALTTDKGAAP